MTAWLRPKGDGDDKDRPATTILVLLASVAALSLLVWTVGSFVGWWS